MPVIIQIVTHNPRQNIQVMGAATISLVLRWFNNLIGLANKKTPQFRYYNHLLTVMSLTMLFSLQNFVLLGPALGFKNSKTVDMIKSEWANFKDCQYCIGDQSSHETLIIGFLFIWCRSELNIPFETRQLVIDTSPWMIGLNMTQTFRYLHINNNPFQLAMELIVTLGPLTVTDNEKHNHFP